MLGADEPRTWLLLFQNSAELRSLGGMPGATAVITADGGHIALTGQGTASIPRFEEPVVELRPDLLGLYGERPAVWFSGTTILPNFAEAAPIAREMWRREPRRRGRRRHFARPVALSYLLRATGPITLPTGETLTSENAADLLLNQVYLKYPEHGHPERRLRERGRDGVQRFLRAAPPTLPHWSARWHRPRRSIASCCGAAPRMNRLSSTRPRCRASCRIRTRMPPGSVSTSTTARARSSATTSTPTRRSPGTRAHRAENRPAIAPP